MQILGAMDGEILVGMCFFRWIPNRPDPLVIPRKVLLLDDICVDEAYRRQGIAELLCGEAIRMAKEEKADSIELGVWADNLPAVSLYQKLGFRPRTMRMELKIDL